jgi:Domain of unknown function (DUF4340)
MNRFLPVLAVVAALLTLLAAWAIGDRIATSVRATQGLMFPELAEMANSVQAIELLQGDRTVNLERATDGSWKLASRDGYPADIELVRGLIVGLSQLQKDQALTRKPERHGELNLTWPDPEGRARLIRLYTASEGKPFEVIIGQERLMPRSSYLRRIGDDQAWRCRGGVNGDVDFQRWIRRDMLSLPATEFLSAKWLGLTVTPRPGAATVNRRPDDYLVTTDGSTPWMPAQAKAARGSLPEWPARMEFDDVRSARPDFAPSADRTLVFTVKGAVLTVEGRKEADGTWFRVSVQPGPGASEPTKNPVAGDPWIPDWNAFAAKVKGWEYRLPEWREAQLERLRSDEPEPKAPAMPDMEGKDRLPPPSSMPPG